MAQGWVFVPLAGASKGLTRALPSAPILTQPSAPSPSPLGEDPWSPGSTTPAFLPKASSENGADQCPDPIPEHPPLGHLFHHRYREVAARSTVSPPSPSQAWEAVTGTGAAAAGSGVPGTAGSPPQTPGTCQTQGFESRWLSYFLPL